MAIVLMPPPQCDFDPTEAAVRWRVLTELGHTVRFATPTGTPGAADDRMLTGRGLDPWGWVPGLDWVVIAGRLLRADKDGRAAYAAMTATVEYGHPIRWDDLDLSGVDGLLLPGGHRARGMQVYLERCVMNAEGGIM